jgi:hypothetical protein
LEPGRDQRAGRNPVPAARYPHEVGKLIDPQPEIVLVEDPFAEPPEETRHAVLQHSAAYRQHGGARREVVPKRQQIVLVAARAVQQQQRRTGRPFSGEEYVRPVER